MTAISMTNTHAAQPPVRGTQLLVEHMGGVFRRPSLVGIELAWRWLAAVPILCLCWIQMQKILAVYPLDASGFNNIDSENPWVAAVQLANVWSYYAPHVMAVLRWLLPVVAVIWIVAAGLGRNLILMRMERGIRFRPLSIMALQTGLMALLALTFYGWFRCLGWAAAAHISSSGQPDLVGYSIWAIFLSLGFFSAWALVSWALAIAPLLALLEKCSALAAIQRSLRLGMRFTSKLAEINLVMGIAKIGLMVLAMVLSAAPLPFVGELGSGVLHAVWVASVIFFLIADDFFQVVRLEAFVAFWRLLREPELS